MPWTSNRWPPQTGDVIDAAVAMNEIRAALAERNALMPVGHVPPAFSRWVALRGTPASAGPPPSPTVANFQYQVSAMLGLVWPLRWWDAGRGDLYTFANLCQDAFARSGWTTDLTALDGQGNPVNRWTPAAAAIFGELYAAINRLNRVRILPNSSGSERSDSVYRLSFGIGDWPDDRAETFTLFDGDDDGQTSGLEFDVGLGGEVFDGGATAQWVLESRRFRTGFATEALAGCSLRRGWLDFTTAAPGGTADFSDTFTAEVTDAGGAVLSTFASTAYGAHHIEVPAGSIRTDGDTEFFIRSAKADAADRPAWAPSGPDYTSTYREGLAVAGPIRLIVEVDFEYEG
jgi:hypothetical protein